MEITKIKNINQNQFQQIDKMWNEEYPVNLKGRFGLLLDGVKNYNHYLIQQNNQVLAWSAEFEKENEIRFSIIVKEEHKGKGLGTLLINRLKLDFDEFYAWVIDHNNDLKENGEFYITPIGFYLKNGFEILNHCRIDNEIIRAVKIKYKVIGFKEIDEVIDKSNK